MTYQIVPESAPFTTEQRAWLNGFLAGVLGVIDQQSAQGESAAVLAAAASLLSSPLGAGMPDGQESDESFPWHDPALSITERMTLAEGMPKEKRLMAAMAQLNCGSCGYLCRTYSAAIASGSEKNLTLCSPGGSETAKALRSLVKESSSQTKPSVNGESKSSEGAPKTESAKGTRDNPVDAKLIASDKLNAAGSAKDTRHVAIDLDGTGLSYRVGDALGVWPTNCTELVSNVLKAAKIDASDSELFEAKCLRTITPELIAVSVDTVRSRHKQNGAVALDAEIVAQLQEFSESDSQYEWDVLEFLEAFPSIGLTANQLAGSLNDQPPRLYSIASSQSLYPKQVHLTVGRVENKLRERNRKGVASTMLSDRLLPGSSLRVFIHPSHGFTIPTDSNAPMIMVGPGTGIAPFIAFLQQREADQAKGRNWLFFGDQKSSTDFLYQEQLEAWQANGLLTHLDLAFSRDTSNKVYVQHRMKERGAKLFEWLEAGAYLFVCGDATKMAVDVDKAIREVIAEHGKMSLAEAKEHLKEMADVKRYVRDVY